MSKVFGIDLGTTYSCIAYIDPTDQAVVLKNAEGDLTTPSAVWFDTAEDVQVGISAKEAAKTDPEKVVTFIKRYIGQAGYVRNIDGVDLKPEEISSYILRKVVNDAEETLRMEGKLDDRYRVKNTIERSQLISELKYAMHDEFAQELTDEECGITDKMSEEEKMTTRTEYYDEHFRADYGEAFELAVKRDVRKNIIENGVRPDGRKLDEVRPLSSQVGILPRCHGSSLFTRGVTQAMNIVTLAPLSYGQLVDTMEVTDGIRRYMHHYNAPSYTVGEVGRMGSPGRREIGHGYLAERALMPVLPSEEEFPYAIRSVTEIMSQNGSTSMAATCSSCLALMDAGVPIKRPVAGVAMGLMMDGDKPYVLTDLMDAEDFAGDMDFKVTGTTEGITALQMDMKVHGLPVSVLAEAIQKAHKGRMFIMDHMMSVLNAPRDHLSPYAPRIEKLMINPDKIGTVIGKGGETINKITAETGAEINIDESGLITVSAADNEKIEKALNWIKSLVEEPEVGKVYTGKVVSIKDFGAFVNILPGIDGMLHISQISDKRVAKVTDVLSMGQEVKVRLEAIDDKGRLSLSMKHVD